MARKPNKYHAQGSYDPHGNYYGSKMEKSFAAELMLKRAAGLIKDFRHQPPAVEFPCGIKWRVDFLVTLDDDSECYVETKGMETETYRLKLKMYRQHIETPLVVMKRQGQHWFIDKQINNPDISWL